MPKSKRDKKISLTRTVKKGLEGKQQLIQNIQDSVDKYARIFIFSVENMRNVQLKTIRYEWRHSRFFFGKNKVMALALGKSIETEYRENLHKLSAQLRGQAGLLFTNKTKEEVLKYFNEFYAPDFARSGNIATQDVDIDAGPLTNFSHSMEPQLRQLGLPTSLNRGVITLTKDYQVCKQGEKLSPEQSRILKLFGNMMAEFRITMEGMWSNDGSWEVFTTTKSLNQTADPQKDEEEIEDS
ncbi:mRNA turnover protein 4 homolog [Octopus bimaculoides]|uniref:Ribosome assembly factor mrt4 n=2 Tax=Octopus bimaculoides TaxID=37653 RepID=A0A0L8FZJ0_OCTBM|nr:mRNA turnover protein 4 homolog [Octopus bimaculoides]|eukprot:XP_014785485.1 PREDICTED: mRNA turnover protein 4 homolog [Octopus bimaculoides]